MIQQAVLPIDQPQRLAVRALIHDDQAAHRRRLPNALGHVTRRAAHEADLAVLVDRRVLVIHRARAVGHAQRRNVAQRIQQFGARPVHDRQHRRVVVTLAPGRAGLEGHLVIAAGQPRHVSLTDARPVPVRQEQVIHIKLPVIAYMVIYAIHDPGHIAAALGPHVRVHDQHGVRRPALVNL